MKTLYSRILIIALFSGLIIQSCKKKLDLPSLNSLDASVALSTKGGIENALNSVYAVLKSERLYGRDMFSVAEALADDAYANGRSSRLISENRNQSASSMANWTTSYGVINEINLILDAIDNIGEAADKARWEGELKFLRALYYFDLVKNYSYIPTFVVENQNRGGVVLSLQGFNTASAASAYKPSRATLQESYALIMTDLYRAVALLSSSGRGGSTARNYASKHAAVALASRVSLYEGNWARADSFSTAAITLSGGIGTMTNTSNYVAGWRAAEHPEGIFQVYFATLAENLGVNTSLAATHTTLSASGAFSSPRQGQGDLVPNHFLLTEMGVSGYPTTTLVSTTTPPPALTYSSDIRNKLFEWGVNASGHYVECTKWLGKNGSANWDNTAVLRWPELYLNRAEAKYKMSNEAGAWSDLNIIRSARIAGFTAPATQNLTGQALLDEILRQRMLEYAFEGYRFYDLKRYGLTINKTLPVVSLPATDFRLLPRIPISDIDGNPNMTQNFGF